MQAHRPIGWFGKLAIQEIQWFQTESEKPENQENLWCSYSQEASSLKTQELPMFQFISKDREKNQSQLEDIQEGGIPSYLAFVLYSYFELIELGPPTLERAIFFTQSMDSKVNLIPKPPHRHTQNNVRSDSWTLFWPRQLSHYRSEVSFKYDSKNRKEYGEKRSSFLVDQLLKVI